jgi:hypothetical protein
MRFGGPLDWQMHAFLAPDCWRLQKRAKSSLMHFHDESDWQTCVFLVQREW